MLFTILGLTKTRRSGSPLQAFYSSFSDNSKLCPVLALKEYEEKSKEICVSTKSRNYLFISVRRPFKPVKVVTIGHWLKGVMKTAGIDMIAFTAHSTQSAATSKAKLAGIPMSEITKAANWSSSPTFCYFYNHPVNSGMFGLS